MAYRAAPVRGMPGPAEIEAVRDAVAHAHGPVLAFCRSGTRSITVWALGQAEAGENTPEALIALGRAAGYDISGALL